MAFDYDAVSSVLAAAGKQSCVCSDLLASDLSRVARHAGENNPHSTSQTDLVVVWPHFTSTTQPC